MNVKLIYPTLLQSANNVESHAWFDIKYRKNKSNKKKDRTINCNCTSTIKIKLFPTRDQRTKLNSLLNDCVDIYNLTNEYIKENKLQKNDINFYKIRKELNNKLKEKCIINGLQKHTADYAVKHCIDVYKSIYAKNPKKEFNVKNLDHNRRRKQLVIEPVNFSKKQNTFFRLGTIKSSLPLVSKRNSVLQYDSIKQTCIIITPKEEQRAIEVHQYNKCGIDIGVRTFLTTYSPEESYEIGTNNNCMIDRINKRLDSIKSQHDEKKMNDKTYKNVFAKYSDKLKNRINDMHNKVARLLLSSYEIINIGKVSTKLMISNLTGNIKEIVKRRLMALSHFKFRMKLKQMADKFGCVVNEINEYMTSKKCCKCGNIKKELKGEKEYNCNKCKLKIDRDINAAVNIYKL